MSEARSYYPAKKVISDHGALFRARPRPQLRWPWYGVVQVHVAADGIHVGRAAQDLTTASASAEQVHSARPRNRNAPR